MSDGNDNAERNTGTRRGRVLLYLGIVFIALAILFATYGLVAYSAWQDAKKERVETDNRVFQEELRKQLLLARDDINDGNFELALRRLDWILNLSPGYPGAIELREVAQSSRARELIPETTPVLNLPPSPTPSLNNDAEPDIGYSELLALIELEQWQSATSEVVAFQARHPNYRRRETNTMLFNASINWGLELLNGDQVELGLYYLNRAEKLGDLPQEVEDYRDWAELYLLGIGYYGVDWGQAIYHFRGLCAAAPYYQDSCARLFESLVAYGDQFAGSMEWCPAEEQYFEAVLIESNEDLNQKLGDARRRCIEATPTPTIVITGTATITSTPTIAAE